MTKTLNIQAPINRDGTNRKSREVAMLSPGYAPVEQRTKEDFILFAKQMARAIRYFDPENPDLIENWEHFFNGDLGSGQNHQPHYALFLTFLKLLEYSKNNLNTLTARHLDFFYENALHVQRREAVPDKVNVIIQIARNLDRYIMEEGTLFLAGKDSLGKDLLYKLMEKTAFNRAVVTHLYSMYIQSESTSFIEHPDENASEENKEPVEHLLDVVHQFHGKSITEKADEELLELEPWSILGNGTLPKTSLGFMIESPILLLREGKRTITFSFTTAYLGEPVRLDSFKLYGNDFQIWLSSETGWIEASINEEEITWQGGKNEVSFTFQFSITLDKVDPPVTVPGEILPGMPDSKMPVAKILLNPESINQPYSVLKFLELININIHVAVEDLRNVLVQNDKSLLDPNKPFTPFGQVPGIGSSFYVGSDEVFNKQLDSLDLNLAWHNLPVTDVENGTCQLDKYYQAYNPIEEIPEDEKNTPPEEGTGTEEGQSKNQSTTPTPVAIDRSNQAFHADLAILRDKSWTPLKQVHPDGVQEVQLFDTENAKAPRTISISLPVDQPDDETIYSPLLHGKRDVHAGELEPLNVDSVRGFVRLTLDSPDFGHSEYTRLYTSIITRNTLESNPEKHLPLPNEPYLPTLKSISLNYASQVNVDIQNQVEKITHLHPFGYSPHDAGHRPMLMPDYSGQGILYIGVQHINPPEDISILFQVAEGTADPDAAIPTITWSYLEGNEWIDFKDTEILTDSTLGFNQSGLVSFHIKSAVDPQQTLLPGDIFWIRAQANSDAAGACKIVEIRAQTATLEFVEQDNAPEHLKTPLAPFSITKLQFPDPAIKEVLQPYASFEGKVREEDKDFYTRISERLRHKSRAVALWDYERLLLEKFPWLYKVKCFNHTNWEEGYEPGSLLIIAISNVHNNRAANPFKPLTSLLNLEAVQQYTKTLCPQYVGIDVKNPFYEEILISFMVKFRDNSNTGYYKDQLQSAIKQYLSPWAYDTSTDINFGGTIYKSSLLNFVEEVSFVDVVTFFKMDHIDVNGNIRINVEEAKASTPISILVSAKEHDIIVIQDDSALCADGIGHMMIEETFTTIK